MQLRLIIENGVTSLVTGVMCIRSEAAPTLTTLSGEVCMLGIELPRDILRPPDNRAELSSTTQIIRNKTAPENLHIPADTKTKTV